MSALLALRHLKVENANAIAGHTWGFPAISHFLGFAHALSRKAKSLGLALDGCGVICHGSQTQAYQPGGWGDWVFSLTRNPPYTPKQAVKLNSKGEPPPFIEEGRMHLDVSLLMEVEGPILGEEQHKALENQLAQLALTLRLAGGTICSLHRAELHLIPDEQQAETQWTRKLMRSLLPGFALVSRTQALADHLEELRQQNPHAEPLDAWLDFAVLKSKAIRPDENDTDEASAEWAPIPKPASGWLVPITIGYRAISELYAPGAVACSRDPNTPFRFVESVYSVGQWLSPHRITGWEDVLWRYQSDPDRGWYLCTNQWQPDEFESSSEFYNEGEKHG